MVNRLKTALDSGEFAVTLELIPGRGAQEEAQLKELTEAKRIYATGCVHAVSITDNPGGNPALLADTVARELHENNISTLVHFTCKDRNRNQMQSQLYALERQGIENLLVMTGDYTYSGWQGRARPVFDLDPVQVLQMSSAMNEGLVVSGPRGDLREQPTHFFTGAVVSPFKWTEGEVLTQYWKLEKKILSGAQYIISQLGYDTRKMQELMLYLSERGYTTPVLANIYIISAGTARYMKSGNVPGCHISDEFLDILAEEAKAEDKGREARYLRAAKMIAIARGLGYAGVHIGGLNLTAEALTWILDTADEIQSQWREWAKEIHYGRPEGFYLYQAAFDERGETTGLNTPEAAPRNEVCRGGKIMRNYGISRFFHHWVLTRDKRCYGLLKKVMDWRERKKGQHRHHGLEHLGKVVLYDCMDCGDCGLEAAVYTCPMTQCPKCQRNGPCGGSEDGWCEVYPHERYCIHFKAYHRLKKYGEVSRLDSFITVPNNWDFYETSGWSNYTHNRDNAAHRQVLPPADKRAEIIKNRKIDS
ncbi:MAG: methylenetetrahydrofolate reductase C-terminal domain-containing protein [Coriobacteriales bacterium]|nr:methylenetetrahydrofolate reductase C-terminal domain-containing protein [Coriobacteriales bacterium]